VHALLKCYTRLPTLPSPWTCLEAGNRSSPNRCLEGTTLRQRVARPRNIHAVPLPALDTPSSGASLQAEARCSRSDLVVHPALLSPRGLLPSLRAHLVPGDQARIETAWTTAAAASNQVLLLHGLGTEHAPARARASAFTTLIAYARPRCAGRAAAGCAAADQAPGRAESVPSRRAGAS